MTPWVCAKPRKTSSVDRRVTRHAGYAISQRCRKRIEELFGWLKSSARLAKVKLRGRSCVDAAFTLALAAYNLIRPAQAPGGADMSVQGKWRVVEIPDYDMALSGACILFAPMAMPPGLWGSPPQAKPSHRECRRKPYRGQRCFAFRRLAEHLLVAFMVRRQCSGAQWFKALAFRSDTPLGLPRSVGEFVSGRRVPRSRMPRKVFS